jgi:hypothetical protein
MKLSPAQQKVVQFMQDNNCQISLSSGVHSFVFFNGLFGTIWSDNNNERAVSVATLFKLKELNVIQDCTPDDAPYWRTDFKLVKY